MRGPRGAGAGVFAEYTDAVGAGLPARLGDADVEAALPRLRERS